MFFDGYLCSSSDYKKQLELMKKINLRFDYECWNSQDGYPVVGNVLSNFDPCFSAMFRITTLILKEPSDRKCEREDFTAEATRRANQDLHEFASNYHKKLVPLEVTNHLENRKQIKLALKLGVDVEISEEQIENANFSEQALTNNTSEEKTHEKVTELYEEIQALERQLNDLKKFKRDTIVTLMGGEKHTENWYQRDAVKIMEKAMKNIKICSPKHILDIIWQKINR